MTNVSLDWSLGQTYINCVKEGDRKAHISHLSRLLWYTCVCVCVYVIIWELYLSNAVQLCSNISWLAESFYSKLFVITIGGKSPSLNLFHCLPKHPLLLIIFFLMVDLKLHRRCINLNCQVLLKTWTMFLLAPSLLLISGSSEVNR